MEGEGVRFAPCGGGVDDLAVGVDERGALGAEHGPDDGMPVGVGLRHELAAAIVDAVAGRAPEAVPNTAGATWGAFGARGKFGGAEGVGLESAVVSCMAGRS